MGTLVALMLLSSGQRICPGGFEPLPAGWVQGNLGAKPTSTTTEAWANTTGFSNLTDLPRNGVYVSVLLSPHRPTSPAFVAGRPFRLPPDLRRPNQVATQEGSTLPEYRFAGRYRRRYNVDLRVDFGRAEPTRSMLQRTQELLDRLRLPARLVSSPGRCDS